MAGETIVWLTAATSIPSISPMKITVLRFEPLFLPISPPPVFYGLGQHAEPPLPLLKLFRAQNRTDTLVKPLAATREILDQASPLLGQVHAHYPVILRVALPPRSKPSLSSLLARRVTREGLISKL